MKKIFNDYMNDKLKLDNKLMLGIACLVVFFSGLFGFIYEVIFYYFDQGMEFLYWRGGNFLPWINIYAIGAALILIICHKYKKKPLVIFLLSILITGILEFGSGFVIDKVFGLRFWDYNVEILNFGNIGGYICLRSVGFFGLSSLFLVYGMVPGCIYLAKKMPRKVFLVISYTIGFMVLVDEIYNLIFTKAFNMPSAGQIYKSFGIRFM
jgi:uncharacterized membrane protein